MNPVTYRWECHHDRGTGKDREQCNAKGKWTKSLNAAAKAGQAHNRSHGWSDWGYAPLGWENKTVNVFMRRIGARNKDLREGCVSIIPYDKLPAYTKPEQTTPRNLVR